MTVTMFSTTRDLFCKFKLVKNFNRRVSSSFSCRRSYAANELNFGGEEISSKPKFVPIIDADFALKIYSNSNPGNMSDVVSGSRYYSVIDEALNVGVSNALELGANSEDLICGIKAACTDVCTYFKRTARMVCTHKEIAKVATVFANGDTELGSCVAKGLEILAKDAQHMIAEEEGLKTEVEYANALLIQGWHPCSPHFFTNKREKICLLESPSIFLLVNKMLNKDVVQAVRLAMRSASITRPQPLLFIAEDVDKGLEGSLQLDESCSSETLCVITPPNPEGQIDRATWRVTMEDIAVLTGGQVVTKESDMDFIPQILGSCKKVRVSEGMVLIYDAARDPKDIEKRNEQMLLRSATESSVLSFYSWRLQLLSQLLRLKVGKARNPDKVYQVIRDTESAMIEGILPGGGIALLNASKELDKLQTTNSDMKHGVQLFQNALKMPLYCIAVAAGFDFSAVVEKLFELDNPALGYDPASGEYIDMLKSGNFDEVANLISEVESIVSDFIMERPGYVHPL